jgi:hypothetical protein
LALLSGRNAKRYAVSAGVFRQDRAGGGAGAGEEQNHHHPRHERTEMQARLSREDAAWAPQRHGNLSMQARARVSWRGFWRNHESLKMAVLRVFLAIFLRGGRFAATAD